MFYRDALNGMFTFGGIYAAGVLGWSVVETGLMGVIAIVVSTLFAWMGGRAAELFGPKRVIMVSIVMVDQGDSSKMTEGFGLYALSGKATSFLTPLSIGAVTAATGSQQMGVTPLVLWLVIGFVLLICGSR